MKLASFDLEIAKAVEGHDWRVQRPLGISCAAVADTVDGQSVQYRMMSDDAPAMSAERCRWIVDVLRNYADNGFTIVTVNGAGFDFSVLAEESGMAAECADLMLHHHCDLMMMSVCKLGWRVGLEALATSAGVKGKLHNVALRDGRIIDNMSGAMAPQLWAEGEHEAVLAYLKDDVRATLETAVNAVLCGHLGWYSIRGKWWQVALKYGRLPTVAECLAWPRPDTSWMSDPTDPSPIVAPARRHSRFCR